MLQFTRQELYAMRIMTYMANRPGEVVRRKDMAEEADMPAHFLSKIAQDLAKAGFIEIVQGSRGGFKLTCKPDEVSMLDIYQAISGELKIHRNLNGDSGLETVLEVVNVHFKGVMANVLLEDMAAGSE